MIEQQRELFPLSLSQLNIWNLERAFPGTSINNISTTVRIRGHLDMPLLQESIQRILACDASLRTRLSVVDGQVMQYHVPYEREEFPVYDFCNTSTAGFENWENSVTRERMPLEEMPLYRFVLFRDGERSGGVLVKLHHIISDGWSQISICNKIAQTYLDLIGNKEPALEPTPDYQLHVAEEQAYLQSRAYSKDEQYWRDQITESDAPSELKHIASSSISPVGQRISFELPQILNHAIYTFCEKNRVAPFAVFYMALAIYFKRVTGAKAFTIGVPIFNRTNYAFKQSTGMFVTTLPFVNQINDEWSINQFNQELMEKWYELLRHQRYPFSKISEMSKKDGRLFNIALSYQDSKILQSRDASVELSGRWHYCGYQAEQLTIHLTNLKDHQHYAVDYDYLAQFFSEEEITSLHHYLCHILSEALDDPDKPIYKLNILSLEEKNTLLYQFNNTDRYLPDGLVYDTLASRCMRYPNRAALICNGERLSYGALLYLSARYAVAIDELGIENNALVAILLPRDFDLFAAMVGSLQIGCGYLLLSADLPTERILSILKQSDASVLITDHAGKKRMQAWSGPTVCAEDIDSYGGFFATQRRFEVNTIAPEEHLAYVVYTSGSTGEPKGVEISHRNLLNLAQEMESVYGQGAVLSLCNVGFDAFVLESIAALLNGRTIVLPSDADLESPEQLAALINGYAVGFCATTPSRLSALLRSKAFRKTMWRMESLVCGGENFPAELLKRIKKLTNARIYNQYGPSETTVGVSLKELSGADRITAGAPMGNCRLYVLDQWLNPLPVGGCGNLYVGGKCVGMGYRRLPQLSAERFLPSPFVTGEQIYRTGDLASWTNTGEIVLMGREDDQVKLRGLRIELQEISSCIETYPGVHDAVAKIISLNGEKVLGAYYCGEDTVTDGALLAHIATYLPRYMVPSFLIRLQELPHNANGKIDEHRLPVPQDTEVWNKDAMSDTGRCILDIYRRILNQPQLHGGSDYFLSGGNSLNAMECVVQIEESLGRRIRIADLYAFRTASRLADFLDGTLQATPVQHTPAPDFYKAVSASVYELSPIQQGIYVQSVLDPSGLTYNMPGAFLLEETPDREKLETAFALLIREDPIFRTVFRMGENGVSAFVQDQVDFHIEDIEAATYQEACEQFLRPFDLQAAPLLRAATWRRDDGRWYLLLDMHHIISDGMSTPVLLERLDEAYRRGALQVQWNYYDYLHTIEKKQLGVVRQKDLEYWVGHLQDLPDPLLLPGDHSRPKEFDFKGREHEMLLSEEESQACRDFCQANGLSVFTLFLSAYGILLSAISGKEDFLIGAPVAGRLMPNTQNICGPFINTLPLRLRPDARQTVGQWLASVQTEVAGMLDHQQVSLEEVIQALNLPRGTQNALYQVMMTQSPVNEEMFTLDGKKMHYCPVPTGTVKMDLVFELAQKADCYLLRLSYATGLFLEETAAFYARCLRRILTGLIADQSVILHQLPLMDEQDHQDFVDIPNNQLTPFVNLPLHKLLHNRSTRMQANTAIIFHDQHISYKDLEKRACAIAQFLVEKGLQPGQCVGLCLSRTPDIIAAMYGVLKAGGCFTFMLPSFPTSRLQYMLKTACAGLMLYDSAQQSQFPQDFLQVECPCPAYPMPEGTLDAFTDVNVGPDQLVNILFTSGSTGQPKGVMLRHRSVSNLYAQVEFLLRPYPGNVLCSTNSVFDCFLVETLVALALGRTVVLADEEEMMLPWKLARLVSVHETAVFEMTPARLQMCLNNDAFCQAADHIRVLLVGGEALTKNLQQKFYAHSSGDLINMYGPSESTIYTTYSALKAEDHITIGKPLPNIRTYVLDQNMRPVLPTACGELYIAGECLASGYISRPDLTEAAFVEDLYFPGEKMYRSGDMVRQRVDGSYEFLGRKDAQVKLNGQRVELAEITSAILETGLVRQAATVAVRNGDGTMELCAFYETESGILDSEEILKCLRRVLPVYMLPAHLLQLAAMPMTASNKIDVLTLQHMATEGIPAELCVTAQSVPQGAQQPVGAVNAKNPNVDYVLSVWNRVLRVPATSAELSFFLQGGTSMAALSVLSCYYNDHHEMSLAEFYAHPTAVQQAQLLCDRCAAVQETQPSAMPLAPVCQVPDSAPAESVQRRENNILITGATGFFGAHLVYELIAGGCEPKILCLLRDGDRQRLLDRLTWYFGRGFVNSVGDRLQVVQGDITQPFLGMTKAHYKQLSEQISEVYHCAADVRHYAADEESYLRTNVDGTVHMLEFARSAEAAFYHISTCSVSGDRVSGSIGLRDFTEQDHDIGQNWNDNIYVKSKFLAEAYVRQAADAGLRVKIFRLGRLVGRMSDGVFQTNPQTNAFYLLLRGFCEVGVLPISAADTPVDIMPIDLSAREVLALKDTEGTVFHIMNSDPPCLSQIAAAFGDQLRMVSDAEFDRVLSEKRDRINPELLGVVMDYLHKSRYAPPQVHPTNHQTEQALKAIGFRTEVSSIKLVLQDFLR